ncbi:TetR/AcrR family transcriptional regulator [Pseudonocardia sp. NPDC049154]|uniref:TetR/AcrR family transcriptional regulator n=1 Tax=Pseudonocardia sp. NPDC049154 TaxID=3155501 RepID=UPI0033E3CA15
MPEDPRVTRSRALILAAAHDHFVAHGYVGANVDLIAAEAGVAKRTVYNIYGGKEALFRAVVEESITIAERFSRELAAGIAAEGLEGVAVRLAGSVLGPRVLPLRRLLIGESRRFPELAVEYYDRAPGLVMRTLAGHLRDQPGLAVDDPQRAAEHLAFLVLGAPLDRALFDASAVPEDLEAVALAGVAAFRRAYAAEARPAPG